jgi:uncharacterized protein YxeA
MKLYKKTAIIIILIIILLCIAIALYSANKRNEKEDAKMENTVSEEHTVEKGDDSEVKNTLFSAYTEDNIKEVKTYAGGKYYTINDREDIRRFLEIIKSVTLTKYDSGYTFEGGFIFEIHLYDGTTTTFGVFSDKIMASTDDYTGYFKTDKNIADELLRLLSVWK